jgi:hypothetical protein
MKLPWRAGSGKIANLELAASSEKLTQDANRRRTIPVRFTVYSTRTTDPS